MTETFYEVLGVPPDADREEIRAAFRAAAKEVHPDVSDHPDAEARFMRVNRAEEVLADPVERRRYDRLGHEAYVRQAGAPDAEEWTEPEGRSEAETDGWTQTEGRAGSETGGRSGAETEGRAGTRTGGTGAGTATQGDPWWARDGGVGADRGSGPGPGTATAAEAGRAEGDPRWRRRRRTAPAPGPRRSPFVRRQEGVVLALAMLVLHPAFLATAIAPQFPLAVNLFVGAVAFVLAVYLAATPYVGVVVFGFWGVVGTAVLVATGQGPASPLTLLVAVGVWMPLALSLAMAWLLP